MRGFSSKQLTTFDFMAVLARALEAAEDGDTCVFFPKRHESWVITRIEALLMRAVQANPRASLPRIKSLFSNLSLSSHVFCVEPARWVVFGFDKTDPLPDWMARRLL
jgi:hypothetical protein